MADTPPMTKDERRRHAERRAARAALRGRADGSRPFDAHATAGATKVRDGSSIRKKF